MLSNVTEYLKRSAIAYPDKIAFRDEQQSLTFSQLERQSKALACKIASALSGKTKQPIGVYLPKGVACIVAFFASAYSGNFYTPIDTAMPKARLSKIFEALRPAAIITDAAHNEAVMEVSPNSTVIDVETWLDGKIDNELLNRIQRTVIDTDPLYVMFTSGSTGMPKGVVVSHRSVIDYTEWLAETFSFTEQTVFGNQAPFYFDNSILDIYSTVRNGCETVIISEERFLSPKRLCLYLDEAGINTIFWVPSALVLIANSGVLETACPTGLEQILFCGEVMPTKQLNIWRRAIPKALYANLYGPTEITDVCTYYIVDREFGNDECLPMGLPCRNTEILVLNEDNRLISGNEIGELCVRGTCLAHGYYGNAEKTSAAFTQNPLNDKYPEKIYRTGDLVRYNERGELIFVGRKDFQIKHMGHRIELGELESAAAAFHATERCCALYDGNDSRILLAVVPEKTDKAELYQYLKTKLPRYMLPGLIVTLPSLPLNSNGKIDRKKTAELLCDKGK
ncbi:AMP-binding protein [Paenibacillus elgii]|uniref:amino acid adenylation domain-containing protein n=1 Tax=Paenibacillus elgii TaxID=189691 RepID=UPI002D7E1188|nr:AMP-binding protein [Paenibacillus elgii]